MTPPWQLRDVTPSQLRLLVQAYKQEWVPLWSRADFSLLYQWLSLLQGKCGPARGRSGTGAGSMFIFPGINLLESDERDIKDEG